MLTIILDGRSFPSVNFEWDRKKEALNFAKHGVDFSGVPVAFNDPSRVFLRYPGMTQAEVRWQCVGFDGAGVLTARFTLRAGAVRVIGAGYWSRQKQIYEKENRIHG